MSAAERLSAAAPNLTLRGDGLGDELEDAIAPTRLGRQVARVIPTFAGDGFGVSALGWIALWSLVCCCCAKQQSSIGGQDVASDAGHGQARADAAPMSSDVPQGACGTRTELGDPYCCGRADELENISCIDLSDGGTIYGRYGHCLGQGELQDARFVGGVCCDGLVEVPMLEEGESQIQGPPPGCHVLSLSGRICTACGDGACQEVENRCNCPADCAESADASAQ